MENKNKKQIIIGIILGIAISFITILLLTTPLLQLKAQQQTKYTVFKTENEGFKFLKKFVGAGTGRSPSETWTLAPLFAETPKDNSPGNQVATKEYVDSKLISNITSTILSTGFTHNVNFPTRGYDIFRGSWVICDDPLKQTAISANYAGWDVGAKEDSWYGVLPLFLKKISETSNEFLAYFKFPIGAVFYDVNGSWVVCANIPENPGKVILYTGYSDLVPIFLGLDAKLEHLTYKPEIYIAIDKSDGYLDDITRVYKKLPCDKDNTKEECAIVEGGVNLTDNLAVDLWNCYRGWYNRYVCNYTLFKRAKIFSYNYSPNIKVIKKDFSYAGVKNWPSKIEEFRINNIQDILGIKLEGYSDDGGICEAQVIAVDKNNMEWNWFSVFTTNEAYASPTTGGGVAWIISNKNSSPMQTCYFDKTLVMDKGNNLNMASTFGDYCYYELRSRIDISNIKDAKLVIWGGNADGPRGEKWSCGVTVLYKEK